MRNDSGQTGALHALEARKIDFTYIRHSNPVLREISLCVSSGERVGLVGPSGCGKTTLAHILAGLINPDCGEVLLDGAPVSSRGYNPVQLIHQHPERAVNPRWKLGKTISEGWEPTGEVLDALGIERGWLNRWPNELSGGELQRFCVARALGPQTKFLIADEMTAMLDVITQAQLWQFISEYANAHQMGLLVITHDEALARRVCTRILSFLNL